MAKKEDAIQTQGPTELTRPDFIPEGSSGLEEIGMRDMVLPRLSLCQTNSKARNRAEKNYIPGLEEGMFFNSLTGTKYGDTIQVVPLFMYHSRIMFKDMKEGGGIICQAPDGKACQLNHGGACLHSSWGPQGEKPECFEFYNYPALVYDGPGINQKNSGTTKEMVIVSLKTTGLKAGRTWNSLMRMRGSNMYAGVYELKSYPDKNQAGISYFAWDVKNGTPAWVDKDLYEHAEKVFKVVSMGLRAGTITVDASTLSDDQFASRDSEV